MIHPNRPIQADKAAKVLVYLFGSLGDTLVAIPALRAVRRHFQNAEIVLLQNVEPGNIVKASEVIPENLVNRYFNYSSNSDKISRFSSFLRLWRRLRDERFQAVIYLVISERPARAVFRDRFFFRSCGIRKLIGFRPFSKDELYPRDAWQRPALTENEAVRKLHRLEFDGVEVLPDEDLRQPLLKFSAEETEKTVRWLAGHRKKPDSRLIAIAPGCKTQANIWPLENFIDIGSRLIAGENCELIVVGGKAEHEMGEKMISAWGEGINAAGEFSVRESGALLAACDFYIGLDTGTTHLSAAVGTPCFAIYGERNNPGHWYPLGSSHSIVFHPVACAGCRFHVCPLPDHPCMTGISADSVWENLMAFIQHLRRPESEKVKIQIT